MGVRNRRMPTLGLLLPAVTASDGEASYPGHVLYYSHLKKVNKVDCPLFEKVCPGSFITACRHNTCNTRRRSRGRQRHKQCRRQYEWSS